jgi:predicted nucleotidyltransferase
MVPEVASKLEPLRALCERHQVQRLWLFGSAIDGETHRFDAESDLDFLVEIDRSAFPLAGFSDPFWQLMSDLQSLFTRRVHLVELAFIKDQDFRDQLMVSRELLYENTVAQAAF